MTDFQQAIDLIDQLGELKQGISAEADQATINKVLQVNKSLAQTLNHPSNVALELAFAPLISVAARIAIDLCLFELLVEHGPLTSSDLASRCGGEELLVVRILRTLSAVGLVDEVAEQRWSANSVTHAMSNEPIAAGHRMLGDITIGAAQMAPKYFREYGHRSPTDPRDGMIQYAFQTKLTLFEFFKTMPSTLRDFNLFMGNTMGNRKDWTDWFPVKEQLLDGAKTDDGTAVFVDIAGGKGHDTIAFEAKFPNAGRLVLQDLPVVTDSLTGLAPAIEVMGYDFFTEQPVKGARVYFFHHILHDWSDKICLEILARLKGSMAPGYSKLLIHDMVVPEVGASAYHAMFDLTMMVANGGMERTETQWRELLDKAGYETLKVWMPQEEDGDGIIEAVVKV